MKTLRVFGFVAALGAAGCHDSPTEPVSPTPAPTATAIPAAWEPVLTIIGTCGDPYAATGSTDSLPGYFIQNTGGGMPDSAIAVLYYNGAQEGGPQTVKLGTGSYSTLHFQELTGTFGMSFTYRGSSATYTKVCNGWVLPTMTPTPAPTATVAPTATPTPTPTITPTTTPGACGPGPGGIC